MYEFKRKFSDAAIRYYDLSQSLSKEAESKRALESAIVCVILAPAGPNRSRLLALMYKDERSSKLALYPILEKMFLDRILRKTEVTSFVSFLEERGLDLQTSDVTAVLDKAVQEHNILAASKVYFNIKFEELGILLNLTATAAEKLASNMISEERLTGHIDQLEKIIYFRKL